VLPQRHHSFQIFQEIVNTLSTLSSRQIMILGDFQCVKHSLGAHKNIGQITSRIFWCLLVCALQAIPSETIWADLLLHFYPQIFAVVQSTGGSLRISTAITSSSFRVRPQLQTPSRKRSGRSEHYGTLSEISNSNDRVQLKCSHMLLPMGWS
jgi:hypothetical protein